MKKTISIGEKEIVMEANAFTPLKFRNMFDEDLILGLSKITESNVNIELISKLAFCMATQGGYEGDLESFLSQFEIEDFYGSLPDIISLWSMNNTQKSQPKKVQGK